MFQKFALSFKSKAIELFSEEFNNNDNHKFSLIDSKSEENQLNSSSIDQKGTILKNPQFNQTLIISLFATISSFEASYLHLQTAHVPNFDVEAINNADKALISNLQTLAEFKQLYNNYYQNPNFNVEFSSGSCLEFQVNENQHKLRAFKSVFNRLQADIDVKDETVSGLRRKLDELEKGNSVLSKRVSFGGFLGEGEGNVEFSGFMPKLDELGKVKNLSKRVSFGEEEGNVEVNSMLSKKVSFGSCLGEEEGNVEGNSMLSKKVSKKVLFGGCLGEEEGNVKVNSMLSKSVSFDGCLGEEGGVEVFLSVGVFDRMLRETFSFSHKFSKVLVGLMRGAGWDLGLVAECVYSGVEYVKKGDNRYALLSYVCLRMFQGFDLEDYGLGDRDRNLTCNGDEKRGFLEELKNHVLMNPMENLRNNPESDFSRFCESKYQELIHPTMESSIFNELDDRDKVVDSWKSLGVFYELFVKMASSVWALHKLAFSFDPRVDIFQVERGVDFSMVYMEDVTRRMNFPCKTRPKVGFTVMPGFKIGQTMIQSQVYLTGFNQ